MNHQLTDPTGVKAIVKPGYTENQVLAGMGRPGRTLTSKSGKTTAMIFTQGSREAVVYMDVSSKKVLDVADGAAGDLTQAKLDSSKP